MGKFLPQNNSWSLSRFFKKCTAEGVQERVSGPHETPGMVALMLQHI